MNFLTIPVGDAVSGPTVSSELGSGGTVRLDAKVVGKGIPGRLSSKHCSFEARTDLLEHVLKMSLGRPLARRKSKLCSLHRFGHCDIEKLTYSRKLVSISVLEVQQ